MIVSLTRELNHSSVGGDTDMSSTQSYWMEIRHVVRNIYRSTNTDNKPILNTDKMKNIVKRYLYVCMYCDILGLSL